MAGDEPTNRLTVKTTYTFDEAVEYLKRKDKQPTRIGKTITWIDIKTGKTVYIGYTS